MGDDPGENVRGILDVVEDGSGKDRVNHSIIFQVDKKAVKNAGERSDDQTAPSTQKEHRIDDDEGVKNRIDAMDAAGRINNARDQYNVAEALNVDVPCKVPQIFQKKKIADGKDVGKNNCLEKCGCRYRRKGLHSLDFDKAGDSEQKCDNSYPGQHQPSQGRGHIFGEKPFRHLNSRSITPV